MTDPAGDNKPVKEPPKIKLNGLGDLDTPAKKPAPAPSIPPVAARPPMPPPKGIAQRLAKAETSKIALTSAKPPTVIRPPLGVKPPSPPDTAKINKGPSRIRSTSVVEEMAQLTAAEEIEAAKKSTVRVHVEEIAKGDTQRLDNQLTDHSVEPDAKKKTARIDLNEVLQGDDNDIFKRRTALLDASKFPPGTITSSAAQMSGPRTIRIKQSDAPSTSILKKPVAPPATEIDEPIAADMAGKKSETARIDLPPEATGAQPPTRRKTIRIKRPEGGSGGPSKTLVVSRSESPAFTPTVERTEEEGPGTAFSIIAIAAMLVSIVLIYVLLAQTVPSGLPFPGTL